MLPLTLILHIFIGSTLAGAAVIAALTLGMTDARSIVVAALAGAVLSLPVSWAIARRLIRNR